jgi:hypothetical protein
MKWELVHHIINVEKTLDVLNILVEKQEKKNVKLLFQLIQSVTFTMLIDVKHNLIV